MGSTPCAIRGTSQLHDGHLDVLFRLASIDRLQIARDEATKNKEHTVLTVLY